MDRISSPSTEPPFVSAVVCTRNRGDRVVATLESILANDYPCFEVILVDQSSERDTEAAVSKFCQDPRFRYLPSATNGAGRARNIGLAAARGEFVLFTDDDCTVPRDWVATTVEILSSDSRTGLVFCSVVPPAEPFDGVVPHHLYKKERQVRSLLACIASLGMGAGMSVRRQAAFHIGGFDEDLGPGSKFGSGEDHDLAIRMLAKGWRIIETPAITIIHYGERTLEEFSRLTERDWYALGAVYAKSIKCRQWSVVLLLLYSAGYRGLLEPLLSLTRLKKPRGFKRFIFLWKGFFQGLWAPIDDHSCRFLSADQHQ